MFCLPSKKYRHRVIVLDSNDPFPRYIFFYRGGLRVMQRSRVSQALRREYICDVCTGPNTSEFLEEVRRICRKIGNTSSIDGLLSVIRDVSARHMQPLSEKRYTKRSNARVWSLYVASYTSKKSTVVYEGYGNSPKHHQGYLF